LGLSGIEQSLMHVRSLFTLGIAALALAAASLRVARADPVADFYRGKELRLIISASVGGGYDIYARAVAKHLSKHLPGNPTIVPQDMPAGGGLAAANHLYNVAERDGSVIAAIQNTVPFELFFGNRQARFDPLKLNWLGTPTTEVALYIVWHSSKIHDLHDAQTREFLAGGAGAASTPVFYGRVFNDILGMKARFITGYPGQNEILLAMENGEVEAMPSPFWSSLKASRPRWVPDHLVRVLFQYGAKPHPELSGIPFALDLLKNDSDRVLLKAASAPLGLGRPFAAPPDIPPERLAALRQAMMETFADPDFLADCDRQRLECSDAKPGPAIAALIAEAYAIPAAVKKRLIDIYQLGQGGSR
jgi:tripartite-type tricarboxylate transporter receptor subunit TctC